MTAARFGADRRFRRRTLLGAALGLAARPWSGAGANGPEITVSCLPAPGAPGFSPRSVSTVGIYDTDWLLRPPFERMLDLMSASSGGISGVRFFGILSSGVPELLKPESGGTVWTDPELPPDFSIPFRALEALTTRGLTPFVSLGFFPPAVSPNPISPPASYERWQQLVSSFLTELAADRRFGPSTIATWRFEVWNEPNEGRFWTGSFDDYLALYHATSDAVRDTGLSIRLGGPAMAYKPESEPDDGPDTLRRFLAFLRDRPDVTCDFVSYHRKGTVHRSFPDPGRLLRAAAEVERLVRQTVPERADSLALINNEADEKIGFETPYLPRMDAFAGSWLTALVSTSARLATQVGGSGAGHRFYPDNANLQLMQQPFDGRRSLYIPVSTDDRTRLVKTSGAVWYDLLPLVEGEMLTSEEHGLKLFPDGDLHLVSTRTTNGVTLLVTWFPTSEPDASERRSFDVRMTEIPFERVNVIEYRIDRMHSNAYTAAGRPTAPNGSGISEDLLAEIRIAQELTFRLPFAGPRATAQGAIRLPVRLAPFATSCFWITPYDPTPVDPPADLRTALLASEIDVRWQAVRHPQLLGYEVERIDEAGIATPLTRRPIRPTLVTDSVQPGRTTYRVRAITSSLIASSWVSVTDGSETTSGSGSRSQ